MSATPEQLARVQDPSTPAIDLQALAAAEPELWPAIVAHPNVYPDLVAWIQASSPAAPVVPEPEAVAPVEYAPTTPLETTPLDRAPTEALTPVAVTPREPRPPFDFAGWIKRRSRILIISGAGVVAAVIVLVLVLTLVVAPQQRAAEEAAAAAAALDKASGKFDSAVKRCELLNKGFTTALATAQEELAVDPALLDDQSVLAALASEIDEASATEPCTAVTMAAEIAEIEKQTGTITDDADRVELATAGLTNATNDVLNSIAAKEAAAAAAAAEVERQQQAALLAARTWTMSNANGYAFTGTLDVSGPTTSFSYGDYTLGASCTFDAATDIAVPVKLTVTATTQGFDTEISALVTLSQSGKSQPHEVVIEAYYSDGPECQSPSYGTTILNGVHWEEPFATGKQGAHQFVVIIRDWKTPATPSGDTAFLSVLRLTVAGGQSSDYTTADRKMVLLTNEAR
ncbi:MAG: hypothetical protein KKH51_01830 [Actinobacteria bacterium]|nr:hypothetical protein [Actinomycetota bacterium]